MEQRAFKSALLHFLLKQKKGCDMNTQIDKIRHLNDELRKNFSKGTALITPGVAALGEQAVARIVKTVEIYDEFCHANDPHEEHDFGAFDVDGQRIFFIQDRLLRQKPVGSLAGPC